MGGCPGVVTVTLFEASFADTARCVIVGPLIVL